MRGEANVIAGTIALRCGGFSTAASHCTAPGYDRPNVPTAPFDQDWAAAHSMVSYPSRPSCAYAPYSPSDAYRPRTSCTTTAYPRSIAFLKIEYPGIARCFP